MIHENPKIAETAQKPYSAAHMQRRKLNSNFKSEPRGQASSKQSTTAFSRPPGTSVGQRRTTALSLKSRSNFNNNNIASDANTVLSAKKLMKENQVYGGGPRLQHKTFKPLRDQGALAAAPAPLKLDPSSTGRFSSDLTGARDLKSQSGYRSNITRRAQPLRLTSESRS